MTLLEIIIVVILLAAASVVSAVAGHFFGVAGRVLGFVGSIVGPFLASRLYAFANSRLLLSPESTPACICGASSREFSYERNVEHSFVERCACSRAYARRGGRVFLIEPGRARPLVSWVRFRGWQPCDEAWAPVKPYR